MTSPDLRQLLESEGVIVLGDHELGYWDGGEDRVFSILSAANDLSSTSQELSTVGSIWPETYHLTTQRSNIVRALDLPADARVLEIGAGCGAVTRCIAERCGTVDAIEPVPARARAARARTRDLDNVTVYVGLLEDLPPEPVYDIIFVIGVLEYVAGGTDERAPYEAFLRGVAQRLRPGGSLVLAIENPLGVKYIAGDPEDHTNRVYDSIEGYPEGTQARTFVRTELESLMRSADLTPRTLMAFPDYKLTKVVMAPDVAGTPPDLLAHLPSFPSPTWTGIRPRALDEGRLWATLVSSGACAEFPNSFLTLATKPGAEPAHLWPEHRIARYFSGIRAPWLATVTTVTADDHDVWFARARLIEGSGPEPRRASVDPQSHPYIPGRLMLDAIGAWDTSDAGRKELLQQWVAYIDARLADSDAAALWDALPHNIVINGADELHCIDEEWTFVGTTRDGLLARGALLTGLALASSTRTAQWTGMATVGDLVDDIGAKLGLPPGWLELAVEQESAFQAEVIGPRAIDPDGVLARHDVAARLRAELALPLSIMPMAPGRERNEDAATVAELNRIRAELTDVDTRTNTTIAAMQRSISWRVTRPLRGLGRLFRRSR